MKKLGGVFAVLAVVVAIGVVLLVKDGFSMTHKSLWHEVKSDEISLTLPRTMKLDKDYSGKKDNKDVLYYSNNKAAVSITKAKYPDPEKMKSVDVEKVLDKYLKENNIKSSLPINDGYYTTYTKTVNTSEGQQTHYCIMGIFADDEAIYGVQLSCLLRDKKDYEPSMMKWLESFDVK